MQLIIRYHFGGKGFAKELTRIKQKIYQKQPVVDKLRLQKFVESEVKSGKIVNTIQRTSKYDDGFDKFLAEYKAKNKNPNIIDMTRYARSQDINDRSNDDMLEQIRLVKEFAQNKKKFQASQIEQKGVIPISQDPNGIRIPNDEMNRPQLQQTRSGVQIAGNFMTILLDRDINSTTTTLARVSSFRQLVFMGDANGVIGYGFGKGSDMESAMQRSIEDCKKNLIPIPMDIFHSCPFDLEYKFNRFKLQLFSRPQGMNAYGHPTLATMLMLTGMVHLSFKCHHRNTTPYALVNAFMGTVTQNQSPQEISERTGYKVYRQYWGKKLPREVITDPVHAGLG